MASPHTETLARLADDVAAGRIRVPITVTYPLAEADEAFAAFGRGSLGKIAITVAG
jgi:NADPH:quinone reductase-like Zn-dependent oxidoreductase